MKFFFGTLIFCLIFVGGFVFWEDPGNRWSSSQEPSTAPGYGQAWIHPKQLDERALKLALLKGEPKADIVYFGSSRVILADSTMGNGAKRTLNLGVSGASVEDLVAFWQALKESRKIPSHIVIFIDPWIFNLNSAQTRWLTNRKLVLSFSADHSLGILSRAGDQIYLWKSSVDSVWSEFTGLFGWENFKASYSKFRGKPSTVLGSKMSILSTDRVPDNESATRWDGAHIYNKEFLKEAEQPGLEVRALAYARTNPVYSLGKWKVDYHAIELLRALLVDIQQHRSTVLLIAPPYHPATLSELRKSEVYGPILDFYLHEVTRVITETQHGGVRFCDAIEASFARCLDSEFLDGMHPTKACTAKIIAACAASP